MSRANYDDWNIAGQEYDSYSSGEISFNSKLNSNLIICSSFILIIFGLINLYSASYPYAIENNLNDYSFVLAQFIYIAFGMLIGAFVIYMPQKLLESICPVFMLLCLLLFGANVFIKTPILLSEKTINIVFMADFMYLSLFFANREEGITKLRELFLPILFTVIFLAAILIQKSFIYAVLFVFVSILMFACGSVGFFGVLLLVLFALVPTACWILSDANNILKLLNYYVPGYYESASGISGLSKAAVSSGHIFGKGLGNGDFKLGLIPDISGEYVFCNFAEEFGFIGVSLMFILFALLIYCSFRSAKHLRHKNRFYSNFSFALSVVLTARFLINISSVLGILPVYGFSLPFFSFSDSIIITIIEIALIYKMSKDNDSIEYHQEQNDFNSGTDFEVGYES